MAELVERGQGAVPRPVRGGAGHDPPRARGPPDQRAADRVLAVDARRPRPRSCRRCASSASASCPTARSAAASSPAATGRSEGSPTTTSAARSRASARPPRRQPADRRGGRGDRRRQGRHAPRRSRSRGCTRRARTSSRSPARRRGGTSRATSRRSTSGCPPTTSRGCPGWQRYRRPLRRHGCRQPLSPGCYTHGRGRLGFAASG